MNAQGQDAPDQIRGARGKFLAMATAYSLGAFNDNFSKQAALLLAVSAGKSQYQGYAIALFALPYILLAAPAGWLADRFPKRRIVIAAKILEVGAMVCGGVGILQVNWALILTMVALMGLHAAIFSPALNGSIPELYPQGYVLRANSLLRLATTGAILLGVATAGLALDREAPAFAGATVGQATVVAIALAAAGLGLLVSLGVPHRPAAAPREKFPWSGPARTLAELNRIRKDRLFAGVLVADIYVWFAGQLQIPIINQMGLGQFGFDKTTTSCLIVAEMLGLAVGGLAIGRARAGASWRRALAPATIALAGCMAAVAGAPLLPVGAQFPALLGLLALAGAAGGVILIPCESFIQTRPTPERKGAAIAAANCAAFVGILAAGPVANLFNKSLAPTNSFAVLAGVSLALGLWLLAALRGEETP